MTAGAQTYAIGWQKISIHSRLSEVTGFVDRLFTFSIVFIF